MATTETETIGWADMKCREEGCDNPVISACRDVVRLQDRDGYQRFAPCAKVYYSCDHHLRESKIIEAVPMWPLAAKG